MKADVHPAGSARRSDKTSDTLNNARGRSSVHVNVNVDVNVNVRYKPIVR